LKLTTNLQDSLIHFEIHFNRCLVYEKTNPKPLIRRACCILWCVHTFQTMKHYFRDNSHDLANTIYVFKNIPLSKMWILLKCHTFNTVQCCTTGTCHLCLKVWHPCCVYIIHEKDVIHWYTALIIANPNQLHVLVAKSCHHQAICNRKCTKEITYLWSHVVIKSMAETSPLRKKCMWMSHLENIFTIQRSVQLKHVAHLDLL
jgi:hypothetical protein